MISPLYFTCILIKIRNIKQIDLLIVNNVVTTTSITYNTSLVINMAPLCMVMVIVIGLIPEVIMGCV